MHPNQSFQNSGSAHSSICSSSSEQAVRQALAWDKLEPHPQGNSHLISEPASPGASPAPLPTENHSPSFFLRFS